jgi:dienelactone hydrolase
LNLLRPILKELGARATLEVFEGADHSFHVPKSSGKGDADMLKELAQSVAQWTRKLTRQ